MISKRCLIFASVIDLSQFAYLLFPPPLFDNFARFILFFFILYFFCNVDLFSSPTAVSATSCKGKFVQGYSNRRRSLLIGAHYKQKNANQRKEYIFPYTSLYQ